MATYQEKECEIHGHTKFILELDKGYEYFRCVKCRSKLRTDWRRNNIEMLRQEHGGSCAICGYDRCKGALHFHHLDPTTKEFGVGSTWRSLEILRKEAKKCILLCANCHTEVENGITSIL